MPKKGKKRAADEPGSAPPPPSKKSKKADVDGEIVVCELSKNRRVSVRSWQGMVMVDIREFYVKGDKTLPGKKGLSLASISLTMDQWNVMQDYINDVNKAVAEFS